MELLPYMHIFPNAAPLLHAYVSWRLTVTLTRRNILQRSVKDSVVDYFDSNAWKRITFPILRNIQINFGMVWSQAIIRSFFFHLICELSSHGLCSWNFDLSRNETEYQNIPISLESILFGLFYCNFPLHRRVLLYCQPQSTVVTFLRIKYWICVLHAKFTGPHAGIFTHKYAHTHTHTGEQRDNLLNFHCCDFTWCRFKYTFTICATIECIHSLIPRNCGECALGVDQMAFAKSLIITCSMVAQQQKASITAAAIVELVLLLLMHKAIRIYSHTHINLVSHDSHHFWFNSRKKLPFKRKGLSKNLVILMQENIRIIEYFIIILLNEWENTFSLLRWTFHSVDPNLSVIREYLKNY